ncbi:MFS transporter [Austwickia sp. TVS 96-490-7B]|uniref:MFS transporter n=1 Tax=Austwickia sp. TVS 96-490-7B TaxID=2830843 RepID=UPI0021023984|nr:MFS transporter [Austwickia sp. TVS 96-490-7B]
MDRNFRLFLVSRGVYTIAISGLPALLAVSVVSQGGGPGELGVVLGIGALPAILGAIASPAVLRRFDQRALFQASCVVWVGGCLTVGLLELTRGVSYFVYVLVTFCLELVAAMLYGAIGSYLPSIVPEGKLQEANGVKSTVFGLAGVAGPLIAVPVTASGDGGRSAAWFGVAALMFLGMLCQTQLPSGRRADGLSGEVGNPFSSSWGYLRRCPGMLVVIFYSAIWHVLGWSCYLVGIPVLLRQNYDSLWAWGVMQAFVSGGVVIGGLVAVMYKASTGRVCITSLLPLLLLVLMVATSAPLWSVTLMSAVSGVGLSVGGVHWATRVQREVPEVLIPAVFSLEYVMSEGVGPVGYLGVPLVMSVFGVGMTMCAASTLALALGVAAVLFFPRRFAYREAGSQKEARL